MSTPLKIVEEDVLFRETQQFRQPRFWFLMAVIGANVIGFVCYVMVKQFLLNDPVGDQPISAPLLVGSGAALVVGVAMFLIFFASARLVTEVSLEGLTVQFLSLLKKEIHVPAGELKCLEPRKFNSVRELRTWGDRSLAPHDIFTMNGQEGVHIELNSGQCYFIGSESPQQLTRALLHCLDPQRYPIQGCGIPQNN